MNLKNNDSVDILFIEKGDIEINDAWIVKLDKHIVAITIDLKTKNCLVSTGVDNNNCKTITLSNSINEKLTTIELPQFKDWDFFSIESYRYTINLCLIKNE